MLNTNLIGAMSGQGRAAATASNPIVMPAIKIVRLGESATVDLNTQSADGITSTYVNDTAKVVGMANNGAMSSTVYTMTTGDVTTDTYKISAGGLMTLPIAGANGKFLDDQLVVTYQRTVTSGYAVVNRSDKYPQTVRLLLKVLYIDPCSAD